MPAAQRHDVVDSDGEATGRKGRWRLHRRSYRWRLVAGMLAVLLPIVLVLSVLLTARASHSLTSATENQAQSEARAGAIRVQDWLAERHQNLSVIADQASGRITDPANVSWVTQTDKTYDAFDLV